ncbi:PadR family transcriptional regulator [Enterococcus raffinosus]|uniref:PadR family transcriptional regulator n=1 Tax=Enterococcus raffinosus TaxID=71452 RepID=UPI001C121417|nr:PadR family transcriptional regulator [Enterococcus raffinosus]MBU5360177.1 PadR family transcriptional regulator [Enterococcus raffinosus]
MPDKDIIQNYVTELKRGNLVLAVLGSLNTPHYGYALLQTLQDRGMEIEANTLYPLLRRLEKQDLLESDWDTTESRPRKYYKISKKGIEVREKLFEEWKEMQKSLIGIYSEG